MPIGCCPITQIWAKLHGIAQIWVNLQIWVIPGSDHPELRQITLGSARIGRVAYFLGWPSTCPIIDPWLYVCGNKVFMQTLTCRYFFGNDNTLRTPLIAWYLWFTCLWTSDTKMLLGLKVRRQPRYLNYLVCAISVDSCHISSQQTLHRDD